LARLNEKVNLSSGRGIRRRTFTGGYVNAHPARYAALCELRIDLRERIGGTGESVGSARAAQSLKVRREVARAPGVDGQAFENGHAVAEPAIRQRHRTARDEPVFTPAPSVHVTRS
jgi:hypothetical protein